MKVGFLSESPSDEAALRVLVEGVLGHKVQVIRPALRARGWPNVIQVLPGVISHLQLRTDADALVMTVDSDDTWVHDIDHDDPAQWTNACRLCQIYDVADKTMKRLMRKSKRPPIKFAFGLAIPALEAWYLCGKDDEVSEQAWVDILEGYSRKYDRRELKRRVYGTVRPTLQQQTERALEETHRLKSKLRVLEDRFPIGFGNLARMVRDWKRAEPR